MGTIDVYWNTNVYEKYSKSFNIVLWAISTDKIGKVLNAIDVSLGIRFYEKSKKIRSIKSGITYNMSEVVMEIPYDLFVIFDDLKQYYSYSYYSRSYDSSINYSFDDWI